MSKTPQQQSTVLSARVTFREALELHEQGQDVEPKLREVGNLLIDAGYNWNDPMQFKELGLTTEQMGTFIKMNKIAQAQHLYNDGGISHARHIYDLLGDVDPLHIDVDSTLNQGFNNETQQLTEMMHLANEHMEELNRVMRESSTTQQQILESNQIATQNHNTHS